MPGNAYVLRPVRPGALPVGRQGFGASTTPPERTPSPYHGRVNELIDTTEMYLRTVYELEEEGVRPLRARIAERLKQSGPTVSQTVARMERDGLLRVEGDRHLELTPEGRRHAVSVMRKHRLAEVLLTRVIGLEWEEVHVEACRWEHVMSDQVERKLVELLDSPEQCPHGNPIPGLREFGATAGPSGSAAKLRTLGASVATGGSGERNVVVRRISEQLQPDVALMRTLYEAGLRPGETVVASPMGDGVRVGVDTGANSVDIDGHVAEHIFVTDT